MTINQDIRNRFNALVAQGKSIIEIKDILSTVNKKTIERWFRELKVRGTMQPNKSPGRPAKHNDRDIRHVMRIAKRNPAFSIAEVRRTAGIEAHHQTMVKILKKDGLISIVAAKKPALNDLKATNRLRFANNHLQRQWKTGEAGASLTSPPFIWIVRKEFEGLLFIATND